MAYIVEIQDLSFAYPKEEVRALDLFDQDASYIRPCVFKISESAFGAALYEMEKFLAQI